MRRRAPAIAARTPSRARAALPFASAVFPKRRKEHRSVTIASFLELKTIWHPIGQ